MVFQALTHELLGSSAGSESNPSANSVELREDLLTNGRGAAPLLVPRIDEVLSFDDDGVDTIHDARALLVCYHNRPRVCGRLAPAADAAAAAAVTLAERKGSASTVAKNAADLKAETCFIKQVAALDAACGIIGLVHGLLNADGLFGGAPKSVGGPAMSLGIRDLPLLPSGPLCRWLDVLPHNATPRQRGRALVADKGIQAAYKVQALRGQSRMPGAASWTNLMTQLAPFFAVLWVVATAAVWWLRGIGPALLYIAATAVLVLIVYIIVRLCSPREQGPKLECHFICLVARGGRVLLFDGMQDSVKDLGACGLDNTMFAQVALSWVRCSLLPTLEQPDTCAILSVSPPAASRAAEP